VITKQNIFDVLQGIAEKVNGTEIPDEVKEYIRLRKSVLERIHVEAQDTAYMHGMYIIDAMVFSKNDLVDDMGWELLYNKVSLSHDVPLSFARALSYGLTSDPMQTKMTCEVDVDAIKDSQRILTGIVFDCVNKGMWELEDAKAFAKEHCPDIPVFDKQEWSEVMTSQMGPEFLDDIEGMEPPKGGEDVFLW
jgi:hypothetical protein